MAQGLKDVMRGFLAKASSRAGRFMAVWYLG